MTDPVRDWRTDWDHADPAWAEDPIAIWTSLREACPVARTERYGGGWLITTHALIDHVTHDTATFSSRETGVRPPGTNTKKSPPITSDPPEHQDHRRILLPSFALVAANSQAPNRIFVQRRNLPSGNRLSPGDCASPPAARALPPLAGPQLGPSPS